MKVFIALKNLAEGLRFIATVLLIFGGVSWLMQYRWYMPIAASLLIFMISLAIDVTARFWLAVSGDKER